MKKLLRIFTLVSPYKASVFFNVLFNLLAAIASLATFASIIPFLKIIFNTADATAATVPGSFEFNQDYIENWLNYTIGTYVNTHGAVDALAITCAIVISSSFLKSITTYLSFYFLAPIRIGVIRDLREKVYNKSIDLPLSYFSDRKKGDLMSRMTNDLAEIEWSVIGSLEMIFKSPIQFTIYFIGLITMSWQLTLFVLLLLPVAGGISVLAKNLKKSAKKGQTKLGGIISLIEESLGGIRILKAFSAEDHMKQRFKSENDSWFRLMTRLFRKQYAASPFSEFMGITISAIILWYGGQLIINQESGLTGDFFILYLMLFSQLIPPAKAFADAWFKIQKGTASLERLDDIFNAKNPITESGIATSIGNFDNHISFSKVDFSYETKQVLFDLSFDIKKGETVALVGPSGGGKSTIADLLARYYDPSSGAISMDNKDLKEYDVHSVRKQMGVVSQQSILFNDTVINNIALGDKNPDIERVKQAAKIANAAEFIEKLDIGYDTIVGDGGNKLSGGQKQRISIARAVYKNPPILILDEATSALDTQSEKLVQDALNNLMKNRTTLVIAHRLSTIQYAHKILVVKDGRIIEQGTHDELVELEGAYKQLVQLQNFG